MHLKLSVAADSVLGPSRLPYGVRVEQPGAPYTGVCPGMVQVLHACLALAGSANLPPCTEVLVVN